MTGPTLWARLKRAHIVQVLVVYLGASYAVIEIAQMLQETAGLPDWVTGFALLLLIIGFVVVTATAWVQSLPTTTAAEQAGERPTDWEIAPGDVVASLVAGKLPHLTWGRAILGGILAISLLFGGAGITSCFRAASRRSDRPRPVPAKPPLPSQCSRSRRGAPIRKCTARAWSTS